MQSINTDSNVFIPGNFKYVEINKEHMLHQKNYLRCIKKARNFVDRLEQSIQKSNYYEDRLVRCRTSHDHLHDNTDCNSFSDTKESADSDSPTPLIDLTESWSTMTLLCIEHQYKELSKLYNDLLQAYNDCCSSLSLRNIEFKKLRNSLKDAHKEITSLNKIILSIGKKYLTLQQKKITQHVWYENRIQHLKSAIKAILGVADQARLMLRDENKEHDIAIVLLLAEIKKCNQLFMENMKLKSQMETK